jgi:heavy metal translocating P-type ATPase
MSDTKSPSVTSQAPSSGQAGPEPDETGSAAAPSQELVIEGMHCNACAIRIQRELSRLPGVLSASVNLATERAYVSYHTGRIGPGDLCQAVKDIGYGASPPAPDRPGSTSGHTDHWPLRAALSWPLAIAALVLALVAPEKSSTGWAVLALAAVVEIVGGWPFTRNAVRLAMHRATNMDTLIAIGTWAALAVTVWLTIELDGRHLHAGKGGTLTAALHSVMAPTIIAIVATGRAIEEQTKKRASAEMHSLLSLRPPATRRVKDADDDIGTLVASETVPVGALIRSRPGEVVPLDGSVVQGWSLVDESMLTGEPLPVERGPGSKVTGGSRSLNGTLVIKTTVIAAESTLARLQALVDAAQQDRSPLQQLADRVTRVFVPLVLSAAVAVFLGWWVASGTLSKAALSSLAVVLVACPCAMGLAAPVAMMVGSGRAASLGVFINGAHTVERLARVDTVAFDKTGTLTSKSAQLSTVIPYPPAQASDVIRLAAAVEKESEHPLARAITEAAFDIPPAEDVRVVAGKGVVGRVGGHVIAVGRLEDHSADCGEEAEVHSCASRGESLVDVRRDGCRLGILGITTPLRQEAHDAVARLRDSGLGTLILSGDNAAAVRSVADAVGIEDARASRSPEDKLKDLQDMKAAGRRVLMVGDGINDAPALAAAEVGCAIGTGSEVAIAASDVTLLGSDLRGVPTAVGLARSTHSVMLQNFGWAMGYNLAALPLAALGLLDPVVAALAMGASSIIVVLNSLRLVRAPGEHSLASRRGALVMSVALPVVLFAGLTLLTQSFSPARGEPLLPTLPSLTDVALPGGSAETYFEPGGVGLNQWHLIFYGSRSNLRTVQPVVMASVDNSPPQRLRQLRVGAGHFTEFVVLRPGTWTFDVTTQYGPRRITFTVTKTIR